MPTLEWIGKSKVINHHLDVPYRVLEEKYTYNAEKSGNMIIHGDNLEALKSLLPEFEGRFKCCVPTNDMKSLRVIVATAAWTVFHGWVFGFRGHASIKAPENVKWYTKLVLEAAEAVRKTQLT